MPGNDFDDAAEDVTPKTVVPRGPWLNYQRLVRELVDRFRKRHGRRGQPVGHPFTPIRIADRTAVEKSIAQTRAMRQQIADGNRRAVPAYASSRLRQSPGVL